MSRPSKRRRVTDDSRTEATSIANDAASATETATKASQSTPRQSSSLFVRSLPATATTESLINYFSESYPIKHATAIIDPATKSCKGYGFVTFTETADALRALAELNGISFQGRRIKLEVAEPRHREYEQTATGERSRRNIPSTTVLEARARREAEKTSIPGPPRLIIRNLPWSFKDPQQLITLFQSYGKVKQAIIPKNKSGQQSGFGFVVLRGRKNAEKALESINGKEIDGRTLAVDWAVDKSTWQGLSTKQEQEATALDDIADVEQVEDEDLARDGLDESEDDSIDEADGGVDIRSDEDEELSEDEEVDDEDEDEDEDEEFENEDRSGTIFVRNLPFTVSDDSLREHFRIFGPVRYARVVMDPNTERPRGTGFVCFFNSADALQCLKSAPRLTTGQVSAKAASSKVVQSVLQDETADPTGKYTIDGRILQLSQAVNKSEATKLTAAGHELRNKRDRDKRRLYLLSEGTISSKSALYELLAPSEIAMREASAKQRKTLIQSNPSLHISLTRLSVRNIPRTVTSKDLKTLAREAVVEFAKDVKAEKRQKLSKEELARGGDDMDAAEKFRKRKGVGIVKQAKVVFEGREGGKVSETSGAGRSRGYGFIEYYTHRSALMGLRWLNGHAVAPPSDARKDNKRPAKGATERKKRLIVEFAIENAQVMKRRKEREQKNREQPAPPKGSSKANGTTPVNGKDRKGKGKRKRDDKDEASEIANDDKEKLARRQRIIGQKRMKRATRRKKQGGP